MQLLQAARNAHGPCLVAEVPANLTGDVGRREGGQLIAPLNVKAVDRRDEADGAHLHEVLERFAAIGVLACEVAYEREVHRDEFVANKRTVLDRGDKESEEFVLARTILLGPGR